MKNIRFFIFGTSFALVVWLTASFATQLHEEEQPNEAIILSAPDSTQTPEEKVDHPSNNTKEDNENNLLSEKVAQTSR
jgi:hypothetical protein